MGEIQRVVSVSFRKGLAFVRGNLHRPYGFGRNSEILYLAGTTKCITSAYGSKTQELRRTDF